MSTGSQSVLLSRTSPSHDYPGQPSSCLKVQASSLARLSLPAGCFVVDRRRHSSHPTTILSLPRMHATIAQSNDMSCFSCLTFLPAVCNVEFFAMAASEFKFAKRHLIRMTFWTDRVSTFQPLDSRCSNRNCDSWTGNIRGVGCQGAKIGIVTTTAVSFCEYRFPLQFCKVS